MPAAAVIPAPLAYVNAAAVKKLVVGSRRPGGGPLYGVTALVLHVGRVFGGGREVLFTGCLVVPSGLL